MLISPAQSMKSLRLVLSTKSGLEAIESSGSQEVELVGFVFLSAMNLVCE